MGYVRTAGMSTAARRARRRAALIMTGLLAGLLLIFGLSLAVIQGWIDLPSGGKADEVVATTAAVPEMEPSEVVVDVLNSTSTPGLAGTTAEALETRGFKVDTVGNADGVVEGVGEIRHGAEGKKAAELLATSIPGKVKLVQDDRDDDTVDLVIGAKWKAIPEADTAVSTDG